MFCRSRVCARARLYVLQEQSVRTRAVELLLIHRAEVNEQDDSGRTALSYACERHCNDIISMLIKNDVQPDIADNKGTVVFFSDFMKTQ